MYRYNEVERVTYFLDIYMYRYNEVERVTYFLDIYMYRYNEVERVTYFLDIYKAYPCTYTITRTGMYDSVCMRHKD